MKSIPFRLWALSLFSAILQLLPFPIAGPVPLWRRIFCWFCLVPLLMALLGKLPDGRRVGLWQATLLSYLCGSAWYMGNCYWIYQTMHIYGSIPELPSFGILVLFALYLGLYHALFGWLVALVHAKCSLRTALCAVPFLWVSVELTRARITGFSWDLLGYAQVDNFLLTRLAPLGGVMLLSFLIAAVNATIAWLVLSPALSRRRSMAVVCAAAVCVLQLAALYAPLPSHADHTAVLLQENLAVGASGRDLVPYPLSRKYRDFISLSSHPNPAPREAQNPAPLASRPDMIVWPEAPADFLTSDAIFQTQLSQLAETTQTPVIVGSVGIDYDPSSPRGYHEFGSAAVFQKDGRYLGRYDKIHRVPWGEYVPYEQFFSAFAGKLISGVGSMEPGTQHKIFDLDGHNVGIFICYESIFGNEVRQFVKNGAQVLVNISDDGWYGDSGAPWQHLDMARMRAIENDRWVLRDTNTGITTAIDPNGRGVFTTPRHVRAAFTFPFDYRSHLTFYTQHGDWFAWLCCLLSLVVLAFGLVRGTSPGKAPRT